ncbi:MAG: LysM peptidoglycan-binding domain-containing protein [Planctomycetes bacterium]|nr:LysM peptidoglycan-binding domain-containing protein [Planctomycetota bacterium]
MMQKDFKIGLVFGAICLLGLLAWLATNKSLSSKARTESLFNQSQGQTPPASPVNVVPASNEQPVTSEAPGTDADTGQPIAQAEPPVPDPEPEPPVFSGREPNLNAPEDPATEQLGPKIKTNRFHIVRQGETLSGISQKLYGTAKRWPQILQANSDRLDAPEKIRPGMYLVIPD